MAGLETAMRDDGDIGLVEMKIVLLVSDLDCETRHWVGHAVRLCASVSLLETTGR